MVARALGWQVPEGRGAMVGFGSIEKRPAFEAYAARVQARPAYARSVRINEDRLQAAGQ